MADQLRITRRQVVGAAGMTGAALATGAGLGELLGKRVPGHVEDAVAACVLTPSKTEGPYFVDEKLNRSDVRSDADGSNVQAGVELTLNLTLLDADASCAPLEGAIVDIWHANAQGLYSDESVNDTVGHQWLRGSQTTDADGKVSFTTIYPGWYPGRAIHIHCKVRLSGGSTTTFTFTTQFFFEESLNDTVMAQSAYSRSGQTRTTNSTDSIYDGDGSTLLLEPTGSVSGGYTANFTLGLSAGGGGGTTTSDDSVDFGLFGATWRRRSGGLRQLRLKTVPGETVSLKVRLTRSGTTLASRTVESLAAGTHYNKVKIPRSVKAGTAKLRIVVTDAASNRKTYKRKVVIPPRLS